VASKKALDPEFFSRMAREQNPDFLFIGCADSRVPANSLMGVEPGNVFVHRNIANLVVNTDLNAQSVIQFAVENLHVRHVIVCGHYGCGGIQAALEHTDHGTLNGWLREIRDVYRVHKDELLPLSEEARLRRLVELNVHEQCVNIIKIACVQRHYLRDGYPVVHGWVYEISEGLIRDLKVPFEEILEEIREVYPLDPAPSGPASKI